MRRKLIRQGNESFTVTLPMKWIKQYKVKAEVEVAEKGNTVEIKPAGVTEEQPKVKEIDITELPDFLFVRIIGACYKAGYDELSIKYKQNQLKAVYRILNELIGYEVIKKSSDHLVIKRVVKSSSEQYNDSEKKCWHIIQDMAKDCLEGIRNNDKNALNSAIEADSMIDKFSDYCMHMLQKYPDLKISNPFVSYLTVFQLEKSADIILEIAESALKNKLNALDSHEKINEYISELYLAYYKFDIETMKKISAKREHIIKELDKSIEKTKGPQQQYAINLKEITNILSSLITQILVQII
jgi:phosphate uptake regulator